MDSPSTPQVTITSCCPQNCCTSSCTRTPGRFLIQRILGTGRLHRHRQVYCLYPESLPSQVRPPYTIVDVTTGGDPAWEEETCPEKNALLIRVYVPLLLRIRDSVNCMYTVSARIEDTLRLRLACPEYESWRGQIFVQAAVRLCGRACSSGATPGQNARIAPCGNCASCGSGCQSGYGNGCCNSCGNACSCNPCTCNPCGGTGIQTPLEVMIEGFLLVSCPVGGTAPACPQQTKPWYPESCADRLCR